MGKVSGHILQLMMDTCMSKGASLSSPSASMPPLWRGRSSSWGPEGGWAGRVALKAPVSGSMPNGTRLGLVCFRRLAFIVSMAIMSVLAIGFASKLQVKYSVCFFPVAGNKMTTTHTP